MCRVLVVSNLGALVETYGRDAVANAIVESMKYAARGGNGDACGFAVFLEDGRWARVRLPAPCNAVAAYMKEKGIHYELARKDARYLLVHARKATVGDPMINANNHPLCMPIDGLATCLIHNGSAKLSSSGSDVESKVKVYLDGATVDSGKLLVLLTDTEAGGGKTLLDRARNAWKTVYGKASVAVANYREMVYTVNTLADIVVARMGDVFVLGTVKDVVNPFAKLAKISDKENCNNLLSGKAKNAMCVPVSLTMFFVDGRLKAHESSPLIPPYYTSETATSTYHYYYTRR